jgi:hypothetical protein
MVLYYTCKATSQEILGVVGGVATTMFRIPWGIPTSVLFFKMPYILFICAPPPHLIKKIKMPSIGFYFFSHDT